jgi:dipeptidyl aminopeptidase/acylaminoacyl peptidase
LTKQRRRNPRASSPIRSHPFNATDMLGMHRLEDVMPSPDGDWVAYTERSWDERSDKTTRSLWVVSADGKRTVRLTRGIGRSDTSPTWSPDGGTIAFISDRGSSRQVWTVRPHGGKLKQLVRLPVDVDNLRWSPRGDQIAFSAEVYTDAKGLGETASRDERRSHEPKAMKFDRLFVRHWDKWYEGKRSHIFVLPVRKPKGGRDWAAGGAPIDVMKGLDGDCPLKPFGGREDFSWSPDGEELAFSAQVGDDRAWSTDVDVFLVRPNHGTPRCITGDNRATSFYPVYSPDGKTIAYLSMARPGFEADRCRIKLFDCRSEETRTLTEDWDRSSGSIAWSADSRFLVVTVPESARVKISRVDAQSGQPSEVLGEHHNTSVTVDRSGRIFFAQDSLVAPADVWTVELDGTGLRRLTHLNDLRVAVAQMSQPEEFHFVGANSEQVQAWILKPVGFVEGRKYPVAFVIHGGPQTATEDTFHYRWNLQAFTGAGYAVVAINYHGSVGFGQRFTDSISGDWGGKPFEDLMKGLDYALQTYTWLDGNRLAALGASFGGWMVNWINGHTDRFRCLVNHDGGFDELSSYFDTDELWFPEWEFGGTPWEHPELYEKFSPGRYVSNWKTPTLVIHGAKDYRITDSEGISTFTALQRRGIPSQLLYFQDEGHWVLKPKDSILWHETILSWLKRWLGS